jgi:hypothetical protein
MGNCPDRFEVCEPPRQTPIQNLEHAAFGFDGGVRGLTQYVPHLRIPMM